MPEIVRCSACRRETYAGQAACPHCQSALVPPHEDPSAEPEAPRTAVEIPHEEFMSGIREGRIGLEFDEARLRGEDFYALMPALYARQIAFWFFVFPIAALLAVMALYWADQFVEGEKISENAIGFVVLMLIALIAAFLLLFKKWAVQRRMLRDEAFYRRAVEGGFVRVKADDRAPGQRPW